jgi:vitamin B12 transporter
MYGGRFDNDFSGAAPTRVRLGGYGLVDVAMAYEMTDAIELTARIENLFDKEYEEVLGYGTPGLAAYGGVKVSF